MTWCEISTQQVGLYPFQEGDSPWVSLDQTHDYKPGSSRLC